MDGIPAQKLTTIADRSWLAQLHLGYLNAEGRTQLVERSHRGPLALQKSLYPEGPGVCHTLILHPPGGIAGGDALELDLKLAARTHVLVTMPGAAKWYRAHGGPASQRLNIRIGTDALLEWLPPETIIFDRVNAKIATSIDLAQGGAYFGWEITCLGRTARGEKFTSGALHQSVDISLAGDLLWTERCRIVGDSLLLSAAAGLARAPVSALLLAVGKSADADVIARCRAIGVAAPARAGITAMPAILAARYAGDSCEQAKEYFIALWKILRPVFGQREAIKPRIWST